VLAAKLDGASHTSSYKSEQAILQTESSVICRSISAGLWKTTPHPAAVSSSLANPPDSMPIAEMPAARAACVWRTNLRRLPILHRAPAVGLIRGDARDDVVRSKKSASGPASDRIYSVSLYALAPPRHDCSSHRRWWRGLCDRHLARPARRAVIPPQRRAVCIALSNEKRSGADALPCKTPEPFCLRIKIFRWKTDQGRPEDRRQIAVRCHRSCRIETSDIRTRAW
jgi:hypothetical protein